MKLALFSQNLTQVHIDKLITLFSKPLAEVNFLYINTPGNYKPYKSEWMIAGEKRWEEVFPLFQEFDLERAIRVQPNFDFKEFLSSYDFIYVSGGNVFILSYWMKKTGCDEIIKELITQNKVVYGGGSAGAIYVCKDLEPYSLVDDPTKAVEQINEGLNIVDFALIPHWVEPEHDKQLEEIKMKFEHKGDTTRTITDDQRLFVEDREINIL